MLITTRTEYLTGMIFYSVEAEGVMFNTIIDVYKTEQAAQQAIDAAKEE